MKKFAILLGAMITAGCASSPARITTIGGYYYLAGDKDCALQLQTGPTQIACGTKKREMRGYRNAMTQQELAAYQAEMQMRQMERRLAIAEIANSLSQTSQSLLNSSQQVLQQSQQFQAPQVQPIPNYGSIGTTYRQVGNTVYSSDGTNYRRIGNTIFGSDGQRCQVVGQNTFCKK
jgi:hypothetical protein